MTLLPILDRELRVRARGRAAYLTRSCVALAGLLLCLQTMESGLFLAPAKLGRFVFNGVVGAAFLVSCTACLLTADAISAEWREGTLGLLFLTPVKVVDVLLGKLVSIGLAGLCALLAFLPVLMIPVLAGGVTGGEAIRKGLGLVDTLFLALVAGLSASASSHDRFRAVRRAILILSLVVSIPFLAYFFGARGLFFYSGLLSPLVLLLRADELAYATSPAFYWTSLVAVHLLSWVLLVCAGLRMQRVVTGVGSDSPPPARHPASRSERVIGLGNWEPSKEDASPVEWLVYHQYGMGAGIWTLAILALALNSWVPFLRQPVGAPKGPLFWVFAWPVGTVAGLVGGAMVAWVASRFFIGARRTGDLELLLTTPLGAEAIVADQWIVMKRFFVWPVLVMQAPMIPHLLRMIQPIDGSPAFGLPFNLALFKSLTVANAFLGAAALCRLGLWLGLTSRTQAGAIVWTVGLAEGLPSLLRLICSVVATAAMDPAAPSFGGNLAVTWWPPELVIAVFYCCLILLAQRRLANALAGVEAPSLSCVRSAGTND